jgi:TolB-like protein/class 3 adenylate cyclase/Flp pilus assembly protein TadD
MAEESQQHRRLAAIMFTDMVGYSALSQKNEMLALDLLNEHRNLLRNVFAQHDGREIEAVGDGFFVEFPSALEAARCAVDIQRVLHDRNDSVLPEHRIVVRVGLHLGDVVAQDNRVHGDGVNIAARIEPLADPGGICVSEDVARQIQNKIELPLRRLGKADLKNIRTPVQIYRLVLPWERKHLPGSERLAFSVRQRHMRRTLIGAGGLLMVGGLAGTWAWRRAQTSAAPINNRIAVLPFVSMSASADDEYFVDGMTEELISRLSRVKGLEVIARTSIASYKGTKKNIGAIAGELNVGTVLEGSVRTADGKVRITAQLINATTDVHLWSEDYDRELKDIFTVQTDIAQHVANALAARLAMVSAVTTSPETHAQESKGAGTQDLEAYNAYLKGRYFYNKGTVEGLHKAIEHFDEAIRHDPSYALAYAAIADTYEQLLGYEGVSTEKYSKARSAALKALELDPSLAEAHTALGVVKTFYDWDWAGADAAFRRALVLNPNSATTHNWYGWHLLYLRRWDDAIAELRRAIELDPVSIIMKADLGFGLSNAGRWDDALQQLQKTLELDPGQSWMLNGIGWAYVGKGMNQQALTAFQKELESPEREVYALAAIASTHAFAGDMAQSLDVLARVKVKAEKAPGLAYQIAVVYWALASRDVRYREEAFQWLERSYRDHDILLVWTSGRWWDGWASDPRWIAFRKKMGLPP